MDPVSRDYVIRTIIGEADDQPAEGQAAVAHVILNRAKSGAFGSASPKDIVLAPGQFSSWSNPRRLLNVDANSADYQKIGKIVDAVSSGDVADPTGGATHFLAPALMKGQLPAWASGPSTTIGGHTFYGGNEDADTMKALGISAKPSAASIPAATAANSDDLAATADALGLSIKPTAPNNTVPAAPVSAPSPSPASAAPAATRPLTDVGFQRQMVEGIPIIGPLFDKAVAASNAAISPLVGDGGGTFSERYAKNLADMNADNEAYAAAHPVAAPAANFLGGAMALGPFAGRGIIGRAMGTVGNTIGARLYGALFGGAAINALDAGARGQDPVTAAEIGGVLGPAGVLGGEAAGRAVTAGINALRGGVGPLENVNPIARGWLANALSNETPESIAAARARMGPEGFAADLNPAMTDLATGVATRAENPASADVSEAYRLRQAGQAQRIDQALTQAMGPPTNIVDHGRFLTEARKAAADPLYEQWRSMQVHPTDELKAMIPRLEASGAFDQAEKLAGITGDSINKSFFTTGPQKEYPTTQTWDYVKRGLDSKIDQAYSSGDNTTARALVGLRNDLVDEIEKTPAGQVWKQARSEFADRSALIDQLEAGRDTFLGGRSGMSVDELREELRGLSGPELMSRIAGMRSAAADAMGDSINGDTTLRNKLLAGNNQKKIKLMLGDKAGQDLIDTLQQEKYLSDQSQYVRPRQGSPTAGRTAAANALEAPPLPHWSPNITEPLSFIPPSWIDALRPSTVLQGGRDASYAGARQQLANVLLTKNGPQMDDLVSAIRSEAAKNANAAAIGARARNALTTFVNAPGVTTARIRGDFQYPSSANVFAAPAH